MKHFWLIYLVYISVTLVGFVDLQKSGITKDFISKLHSRGPTARGKESYVTGFADLSKWQALYKCNRNENAFNSPVAISSSEAQKSLRQTLMVFSEKPEEDIYFLSTYYEVGNMQMESFNIQLNTDDTYREATHVSGLGKPDHRFFKSALIMFRPGNDSEPLDTQQHFHTIDGIEYPMEIMFRFETATATEKTQIHVMVELSNEENPAWTPILDAFAGLKRKTMNGYCLRKQWINRAKERLEETKKTYMEALKTQKNKTDGQTYEIKVYELTALLGVLKDAKNESINNLTNLYSNALAEKLKCKQDNIAVGARIKKVKENIVAISLNQSTVDPKQKKSRQKVLNELKEIIEQLSKKAKRILNTCTDKATKKAYEFERELNHQKQLLRKGRVGSEPTAVFSSVQDITEVLDEMKKKYVEFKQALTEYQHAERQLEKLMSIPERAEKIQDPFQISWLFPALGGYFSYKGSNPVPPCERMPYVIVLETPITISSEQLQEFQDFPSFTDPSSEKSIKEICNLTTKNDNVDSVTILEILSGMKKLSPQVPYSVPLGKRRVYYNSKNIQFIDDDGLHMKSSTRARLKGLQASSSTKISNKIALFLLINFINVFRRHILQYFF